MMETPNKLENPEIWEDVWIPTQCRRCHAQCGVLAHRINGVIVKLEGIPESSCGGHGGLCSRGMSGLQLLYDPNRLKVPLRRTNPEKGVGVDPKWKEISWDEALDEIAARLKKTMDEDPSKILLMGGIGLVGLNILSCIDGMIPLLATEKGFPVYYWDCGIICGSAGHLANQMFHTAFIQMPDWKYCNYQLQFGTNVGVGTFWQYANRLSAEAIERGMKLVVFDPVCNYAAAKATEWVQLLPGTDGAVCMAMGNVIVNELGIVDKVYLKQKSNAPYLIGPDGKYVRDEETNKPMVWDSGTGKARAFDGPGSVDLALDGDYEVNGIHCRPCWQAQKEKYKEWPVERASKISGVPADTIRRIATEFAEAAQVGSTITIDGKELPYRPVGTLHLRAAVYHSNAGVTAHAIEMLPHIVGAANVPGGNAAPSAECQGYVGTGLPHSTVVANPDGYAINDGIYLLMHFPPAEPTFTGKNKAMNDVFNQCHGSGLLGVADREEIWEKAGIDGSFDVAMSMGRNPLMSGQNPENLARMIKKIPFVVDYDIMPNEYNEGFADILLPDTCYLEYSDWGGIEYRYHNQSSALEDPWCFHITQKVVEPMYERRHAAETFIEILYRMGLRPKVNGFISGYLGLSPEEALRPDEQIVWEDLCDRVVRHNFGPEHNWEWFKKNGFISWPKKVEEVYWKYERPGRVPLYWEFFIHSAEKARSIVEKMGIELKWGHFTPVADWFPIHPLTADDDVHDLLCFNVGDSLCATSTSTEQPWVDEMSQMNPYSYNFTMNVDTAVAKGLKDGDRIEVESDKGNKLTGLLKTRKAQHPLTVCVMGRTGHWALGQPIAKGKGIAFQYMMDTKFTECDPLTWHPEPCVKVKITKIK